VETNGFDFVPRRVGEALRDVQRGAIGGVGEEDEVRAGMVGWEE
jgi:hypothetical protein